MHVIICGGSIKGLNGIYDRAAVLNKILNKIKYMVDPIKSNFESESKSVHSGARMKDSRKSKFRYLFVRKPG